MKYSRAILIVVLLCPVGCSSPTSQQRPQRGQDFSIPVGSDEELHFVWIEDLGLWAGKYQVTVGQFNAYRQKLQQPASDNPVIRVTAREAKKYCRWLNFSNFRFLPRGYRFRLPTEMEWVAMASCGEDRFYPWGNEWPPTPMADGVIPPLGSESRPVHKSGMNEWGLYGMASNVGDICGDWYDYSMRWYRSRAIRGFGLITTRSRFNILPSILNPLVRSGTRRWDVGFRVVAAPRPERRSWQRYRNELIKSCDEAIVTSWPFFGERRNWRMVELDDNGILSVNLRRSRRESEIHDLSPLSHIPINELDISNQPVRDLSPIGSLPLVGLVLRGCTEIESLEPLAGMNTLQTLDVRGLEHMLTPDIVSALPNLRRFERGGHPLKNVMDLINSGHLTEAEAELSEWIEKCALIDAMKDPLVEALEALRLKSQPPNGDAGEADIDTERISFGAGEDGEIRAIDLGDGVSLELAWITPGEFSMGSTREPHRVTISKGFWMGIYPVTQRHYQQLMGNNPSYFKDAGLDAPVETVNWHHAKAFCEKLQDRLPDEFHNMTVRLPTEAEWEYACRAGTKTRLYSGKELTTSRISHHARCPNLEEIAWYIGNSGRSTRPVGQKMPNQFGLYDMLGNVWEWCEDGLREYTDTAVTDPLGFGRRRARRGKSYSGWAAYFGSARRNGMDPLHQSSSVGFRIVIVSH